MNIICLIICLTLSVLSANAMDNIISMAPEIRGIGDDDKSKVINNILVIIDMQECYEAANSELVQEEIIKEIRRAKNSEEIIFYVEYRSGYSTLLMLLVELSDYCRAYKVKKMPLLQWRQFMQNCRDSVLKMLITCAFAE